MTIQQTIASLDEMRASAIQDRGNEWKTNVYSTKLHDAYDTLRNAALEAERYKRAGDILVRCFAGMDVHFEDTVLLKYEKLACEQVSKVWRARRDDIVKAYRSSCEGEK